MKHIYTSIDIGSDAIKIVVAELYQNKINLLASTSTTSKGIKKGLIVDFDQALESVRNALNDIESMLGLKIKKAIASIPSFNAEYSIIKGDIKINNEESIVTHEDVLNALEVAVRSTQFNTREKVTILPIDYTLDDQAFIKNPVGMKGTTLGCKAVLATTPKKNVYSVVTLLEKLGIEVVDISLNNIGDIYCFNNSKFEDKIGAIINIGSDITNVSLYSKSILVKSSIINMGGKNINNDISYMYKVKDDVAEHLKLSFALAHKKNASVNDLVEVTNAEEELIKINQFELSEVVMSRTEEILNEAKKEINLLTSKKIDYIIITGGTSNIPGFEYVVKDVFGENANIGNVKMLGIRDNTFSSCIGNLVYFISKLKLKNQKYSMINDNEMYQITSQTARKLNTSDSMLKNLFGYFFSE